MTGGRWPDVAASLLLLGLAAYILREAIGLAYTEEGIPGPGFAPFWIGLGLGLAAAANLAAALAAPRPAPPLPARARGVPGSVLVGAVTVAWVVLLPGLGLAASLAAFMVAAPWLLGVRRWPVLLGLAAAMPLAFHLVFERWLGLPLPRGTWF